MKDRIRELRKALDLTQQEFADTIGVKRNTIANYEIGRNDPVDSVKSLICLKFNVNPEWLDTGEGDMFVEVDPEDDLMEWAADVLRDKPESFRRSIVTALRVFTVEDWKEIEMLCDKLLEAQKKSAPEGAEESVTEDSDG